MPRARGVVVRVSVCKAFPWLSACKTLATLHIESTSRFFMLFPFIGTTTPAPYKKFNCGLTVPHSQTNYARASTDPQAPSGSKRASCVPPPPNLGPRRRLPRAQVESTTGTEITVSMPGKAQIFVRDPRPLRPPARKPKNETQDQEGVPFTFQCYGAPVTVPTLGEAACP